MAEVWVADYPDLSPRIAYRWAHNLSHQEVADRWNDLQIGEPTTSKARIYEFEVWPDGGRRPSLDGLNMLARIYETTARALLSDSEYSMYDDKTRREIDRVDHRSLDANQRRQALDVSAAEDVPMLLITRPKIVHPVDGKEMLLVESSRDDHPEVDQQLFYMDATPVTNEDYAKYIEEEGCKPPAHWRAGNVPDEILDHPVVNVTWRDASGYAQWAGKRLPTVPEWELAAGGPQHHQFPWGNRHSVAKCNVRESGLNVTTPVAKYRSGVSVFGIYDLSGNVWEWCSTQTTAGRYVLKGSAFTSPFEAARTTAVNDADADMQDDDTGFRCVCGPSMLS